MKHDTSQRDALILAVDETLCVIADALYRLSDQDDSRERFPLVVTDKLSHALRSVHRYQPRAVIVCASREHLGKTSTLIEQLHRRRSHDPVLAIVGKHDDQVERAVRIAGATHYFPIESASDARAIGDVIGGASIRVSVSTLGRQRSVKRSRASPPAPRSRGHPHSSFLF